MRLAMVAAGFTPGEADQLRRAMGAWRRPGLIEQFRTKLIDGMTANGFSSDFAERVFRQIRGFGEYGFPESHAASFALLVYVSAWLKCYYPAQFTAALLNSQPMGFYAPAQLVRDAQNHGVEIRPVDVNASDWDCTLEEGCRLKAVGCRQGLNLEVGGMPSCGGAVDRDDMPVSSSLKSQASSLSSSLAIRLGFRQLIGMAQSAADAIVQARGDRPFISVADLSRRSGIGQGVLARLAKADALRSLGLDRRAGLWQALGPATEQLPLFGLAPEPDDLITLPRMDPAAEVVADYRTAGLSLKGHPMSFVRARLDRSRILTAERLAQVADGKWARVAGIVLLRQRPSTAKGITFVTLEDETGTANLLIRPEIWDRYRPVAKTASALIAHGSLQNQAGVIHLLVRKLEDLSRHLSDMPQRSRDFR